MSDNRVLLQQMFDELEVVFLKCGVGTPWHTQPSGWKIKWEAWLKEKLAELEHQRFLAETHTPKWIKGDFNLKDVFVPLDEVKVTIPISSNSADEPHRTPKRRGRPPKKVE